ncbi:MAG: membrane complex biogenesis BtpA family protein [Phycisphaerales bacterium]|jgi:membrane complex biogenesis BtpA family protein
MTTPSTTPYPVAGVLPERALIGMVHVGPLPGTPFHAGESMELFAARAADDAKALARAGFDAIIVENMHDRPYVHGDRLGPETTAYMTRLVMEVIAAADLPIGVQILSGGNRHSLGVAHATGAQFIRCENFVYSHVADEGILLEAEAGPLLRFRKHIGAQHIPIFCDIKKKHASQALTADLSIGQFAEGAKFFGADGLVITGSSTGHPTSLADVKEAAKASGLPVLVGSGANPDDAAELLTAASGLIVGSYIKRDGDWTNSVDPERAAALVKAARG